jgi:DNA-binding GntR family transcriptional regulator
MPADPPPFDLHLARAAFSNAGALHHEATLVGGPRIGPAELDALRAADAAFTLALEEGRISDAIVADDGFHQVLVTAAADPDIQVSVDLLVPRLRRMDLWLFTRKSFARGANTHPQIIDALAAGDVETAAALVQRSFVDAGELLSAALERLAR